MAAAASVLFTVFVTWPQAVYLSTRVAEHQDSLFSMWRLSWIAHAVRSDPRHLFDANIFHPATATLAYSDAMLLEGLLGAPLLWAGLSPVTTYNVMLLGGIAVSGLGMFVLSRYLTGATGPSFVSAAVFTMAPYRTEHFMHLELQWAMWVPLTFWAIHRAVHKPSWRGGALAGIFLWLQILSSVYYGVFLGIAAAVLVLLLLVTDARRASRMLPSLIVGAMLAFVMAVPYALPYIRNAGALGERDLGEIARYSAQPISYLASPPQNWLWGWTSRWGGAELHLFPGLTAVGLAIVSVFSKYRKAAWIYAGLALVLAELSLGTNGRIYSILLVEGSLLQGLRAPSRLGLLVSCAVAMGAGFGTAAVTERCPRSFRWLVASAVLAFLVVEYANRGMALASPGSMDRATLYRAMRATGPGVVIDFPVPLPEALPGHDPFYQYWSSSHWYPMVNGYSGYYPEGYIRTLEQMRRFPDDESIARLKRLHVRYIVLHRKFLGPEAYSSMFERLRSRKETTFVGTLFDPVGEAGLFILEP